MKFLKENWLIIAVVSAIVLILYSIKTRGLFGFLGGMISGESQEPVSPVPEAQNVITSQKAQSLADRMFNAFNYTFGTDLEALDYVYDEISSIPGSIVDVSNAFGRRKYAISGYGFFASLGIGSDLNLLGWINEELSGDQLKKWLKLFNAAGL